MLRVVPFARQRIGKRLARFFERHAVLSEIRLCLLRIPDDARLLVHATEATSVLLVSAIGAERAEAVERPDPIRVAVGPVELQRVIAHRLYGL